MRVTPFFHNSPKDETDVSSEEKITHIGKMTVYSERLVGERIATRSYRMLKYAGQEGDNLVYTGDVDGDGIDDRFVGVLWSRANGRGKLEFGKSDGTFSESIPEHFTNVHGHTISAGEKIRVEDPYDDSLNHDEVEHFDVRFANLSNSTQPEYMYVAVVALVKSGVNFFYNVDQCEPR